MQWLLDLTLAFWATLAEMAPWLLFGFLAAGILSVLFKPAWVERHLGGGGVGPVVKASVLGVPLPLCSCGVIPVGTGLYRHGASRGATSSFLLSTPQTGVDSLFATYALMGPVFAIIRPVVALITGIVGGLVIDRVTSDTSDPIPPPTPTDDACCGHALPTEAAGCCDSSPGTTTAGDDCGSSDPADPAFSKWRSALRYAAVTLPADIAGSLLLGLVVAALLTVLVPADALAPYLGGGLLAMLAAVAFSTPLYICATGSIPVGLGLLAVGASPGAVLAFLIAGPATNAATLAVTWKVMGRTTGLLYLATVVVAAIAAGLALDATFTLATLRLPVAAMNAHEHGLTWLDHGWAVALAVLLLPAVFTRLLRPGKASVCCEDDSRPTDDAASSHALPSNA